MTGDGGFDPLRGDSIFTFLRPEEYSEVKDTIFSFLREVFDKRSGSPDLIVAAERKGMRVLKDFIRENGNGITIVSDMDLDTDDVTGKNVLIFDDSVHTGRKVVSIIKEVSKSGPASIRLACIMMNEKARTDILAAHTDLQAFDHLNLFPTYDIQYERYQRWFMTFLSGIIVKGNPDYPLLHVKIVGIDAHTLQELLKGVLYCEFAAESDYSVESISDDRGCANKTFLLDHNGGCVPTEFETMVEDDLAKVRCLMVDEREHIDLFIVPMIAPRFNDIGCEGLLEEGWCLKRGGSGLGPETACMVCIPRTINLGFLRTLERSLGSKIIEKNGKIVERRLNEPSRGRYVRRSGL